MDEWDDDLDGADRKVFGIGLSRTGTTTLADALAILGYQSKHFPTQEQHFFFYEALTDTPVTIRFKELYETYPGSKFVYTVREIGGWLDSCRRFFTHRKGKDYGNAINRRLYGTAGFDEGLFRAAYARHDAEVRGYFGGRSADLLTVDLCDGISGWEPLCRFLGKPVPDDPFPWANKFAIDTEIRST